MSIYLHNRREFLKLLGLSTTGILSNKLLSGCGSSKLPHSTSAFPQWEFSKQAPTLGGNPEAAWWTRGNYAPVDNEIEAFDLSVQGSIPPELEGVFLRNSSNALSFTPSHWFFGDGMLHGVRFSNGKALWYRNRWIQTEAFKTNVGDSLLGNRANTSLVQHNGKVLALYESGPPHEIRAEDLTTVGSFNFDGKLNGAMTAHPKIDPKTNQLFFIGYAPFPPYLTYYEVSPTGELVRTVPIEMPHGSMMHDFQLTENYVIFFDLPVHFDLESDQDFPVKWASDAEARIGIMPRDGDNSEITWINTKACFMFHSFNAYETGSNELVLEGCRMPSLWADGNLQSFPLAVPWQWTFKLETKSVTESQFHPLNIEFPIIDARRQGRFHRVNYGLQQAAETQDYPIHPIGIAKYDRVQEKTDLWSHGEAVQPDEIAFVPASPSASEDEGWILSMVYDRVNARSEVIILDASQLSKGPIARVAMPRRVPFGFHGTWVPLESER